MMLLMLAADCGRVTGNTEVILHQIACPVIQERSFAINVRYELFVQLHVGALHCSVNSMVILTSFGGIRSWSSHDQAALVKYANNRKVWLNLRDAFPHPYTAASAEAFLELVRRQDPTTYYAIATREEA